MHDTYSLLRELADSWALLALFLFFVGAFAFAWRPGSRPLHDDAGRVPFRHEDRPREAAGAPATAPRLDRPRTCGGPCDGCTCDPASEA